MFEIVQESVKVCTTGMSYLHTFIQQQINRLYAQNPVFKMVHGESVIVYLHMYSENVQQNPLCIESSCVTKVFSIFPPFSPTIFHRDANSVELLLQILAHLCTAVLIGSMRRTVCSKLFVRRA